VTKTAKRLRLSNALRDRLLAACADAVAISARMSGPAARAAIYRLGADTFRDRVKLAWAAEPQAQTWPALLAVADGWTPPPFPLSGEQIKAAGVPEGPQVGRVRREIEAWWIGRDFAPGTADALRYLSTLAEGAGPLHQASPGPPPPVGED
jgi:poly(A) polymerase